MNYDSLHLLKVTKAWRLGVFDALKPYGIALPAYLLLAALYHMQFEIGRSPNQKEMAEFASLDLNVTSQAAKYLVEHHLVNRQTSETDSRAYTLSLTLAGEQLVKQTRAAVEVFENEFFSGADKEVLFQELSKLLHA